MAANYNGEITYIKMMITPWQVDEHGNLWREIYSTGRERTKAAMARIKDPRLAGSPAEGSRGEHAERSL